MTDQQKNLIRQMRADGKSMIQIAECMDLSINTVKSYCRRSLLTTDTLTGVNRRNDPTLCRHCGKNIKAKKKTKPKTFCSEQCRRNWWKANGTAGNNRKAYYHLVCSFCETAFISYGNSKRKFCSHQCYVRSRFGGDGGDKRPIGP